MTIIQSFYTYLSAQTAVTDLLADTDSIWPSRVPQGKPFPAVTFGLEDDQDQVLLDGTTSGMHIAMVEVWCWTRTGPSAHDLAAAVKTALLGVYGTFGSHEVDPIAKTFEDSDFEVDTELHYVRLVFKIPYR